MKIRILSFVLLCFLLSSCVVKVACVGDSITEGYGLKKQSETGYPVVLGNLLGKHYQVLNSGRSSATMQKKGDLPYWDCKEFSNVFVFHPSVIIIKLGTNDSKTNLWKIGEYEKDYQAMIDTFNTIKPRPKIYLCKPVPVFYTRWTINDSTIVKGVIPAVEDIAAKNHLQVIDLYNGMKDQASNFSDGIHPNEAAVQKMARIIAIAIK